MLIWLSRAELLSDRGAGEGDTVSTFTTAINACNAELWICKPSTRRRYREERTNITGCSGGGSDGGGGWRVTKGCKWRRRERRRLGDITFSEQEHDHR